MSSERVAVAGRPSIGHVVVCVIAAAGLGTLGFTVAFTLATASASSPWEAFGVAAVLLAFWAPATCWAWWGFVPAVLVVGVLLAILTHRRRPPERGPRWRRAGRICAGAVLVYGAWTVVVGAWILLELAAAAAA